ncbi:hypothetical protein HGA13_09955 [Nocardia speluncae]|uniref:DUF4232 domain-containing protein n=1 Tax=Nocardia speluncae TaxID=419477 RepID=A0A846XBS9_9NOCA|nr:hypothetical protein [Nocardia speluncae]NKY33392.1 hypothetical protein [Nocardia speluncae]
MRKFLRPFAVGAIAATALLPVAAPAGAQTAADFQDARVDVAPGCAGTVRSQVAVTPLPTDIAGVGVSVLFRADRPDPSCTLSATVSWRNTATGATGSEEVAVSSVPAPGGWFPTDHGFQRALADTGPGPVVITMSTNPGEVSVTV